MRVISFVNRKQDITFGIIVESGLLNPRFDRSLVNIINDTHNAISDSVMSKMYNKSER